VVDVRAYPASRRHPQFGRESLERSLAGAGIQYVWEGKSLGGRRKPERNSPHVSLKNAGFRAYAGHMETQAFREGIARVIEISRQRRIAIMCAERLPWQCHRYLISDTLVAGGARVRHLVNPGQITEHGLNPLARRDGQRLVYDAGDQLALGV
jgi:uncharacterized protein (DUF488 family)